VEQCLRFGTRTVITSRWLPLPRTTTSLGASLGCSEFGDGKWNLAFFLLRTSLRRGESSLHRRGRLGRAGCVLHRSESAHFHKCAVCRRAPTTDQRISVRAGPARRAHCRYLMLRIVPLAAQCTRTGIKKSKCSRQHGPSRSWGRPLNAEAGGPLLDGVHLDAALCTRCDFARSCDRSHGIHRSSPAS